MLIVSQDMLTIELAPLLWNIITVSQRDDQRLCKISRIGLRALSWSVLTPRSSCTMILELTKNRLQHNIWISCSRNIHFSRDELDPDQGILWLKLLRLCMRYFLPPDILRLADATLSQDVAEQVISAPHTFSTDQVLTSRRYRQQWARHSCLYSALQRTSCFSLS